MFNEYGYSSPCPLLKVHWLRLVVDEGEDQNFVSENSLVMLKF